MLEFPFGVLNILMVCTVLIYIRAGRGSEPVGRRGPETSPKCWYMYGPCWATSISKLMFPKKYAWYPPLKQSLNFILKKQFV